MLKYASMGLCAIVATALVGACSSSDDASNSGGNGSGSGGNGSGADGSGATGNVPNNGDPDPSDQYPGGRRELESEEIEEIRGPACQGLMSEPESSPAVLMMVVDTSASMECVPGTGAGPGSQCVFDNANSKWAGTQPALRDAVESLPQTTAVGLLFYPGVDRTGEPNQTPQPIEWCVAVDSMVPVGSGAESHDAVIAAIDAQEPQGCTPTHAAYQTGLEELRASTALGQKYMLLITDGEPTQRLDCTGECRPSGPVDTQPIVEAIGAAQSQDGIRTFVIGSPGSEIGQDGSDLRPWLSQAAQVGGTAVLDCSDDGPQYCHLDLTQSEDFSQALRQALSSVLGQIISCTYTIPLPPEGETIDPNAVNLIATLGGQDYLLARDDDPRCVEGWYYDADQNVQLCSQTCADVKADMTAQLELLFGCVDLQIIR